MESEKREPYIHLPRGGILLAASCGNIQFGIPPETIKDTMGIEGGVPATYVVPHHMFDITHGIALAEIEFPIYFNFFIKKGKTRIICTASQRHRLKAALTESLFGPQTIDLADEFPQGAETPGFPDLRREMDHFRKLPFGLKKRMELDDLVELIIFDDAGKASCDDLEVRYDHLFNYHFFDQGQKIATIQRNVALTTRGAKIQPGHPIFRPPLFGITTLGAGHGFDPQADTSGLIIWCNRRGVMVDPPVNSTLNLENLGVSPKLIDHIILTHCHADHDAGTLQKILREGKLNVHTTATIFESFMRKASALTGIKETHLRKMVNFYPITIGQPIKISGGEFIFNYTLHSIPTISIQVSLLGKSVIYSSDTINDPHYIEQMYQQGVIGQARRDMLVDFPWDKNVILHEAGVPPLHTPIEYLCSLPEQVRDRLYLVHVTADNIPENSGLQIAPTGLTNTIELDVNPLPFDEAIELLDVISHIDILRQLTIEKAREFLICSQEERFSAGQVIFHEGARGDKLYIIIDGEVEIETGGEILTQYSSSDYFGEKSIFLKQQRTATARAKSDVRMFSIHKEDLIGLVRGTEGERTLSNLALIQDKSLRHVLDANPFFHDLTPTQQTQLHSIMQPVSKSFPPGTPILRENTPVEECYVVNQGRVNAYKEDKLIAVLGVGDLIDINSIFDADAKAAFTFVPEDPVTLYRIGRNALKQYLDHNPGFYIKMYYYNYYGKMGT